MFLSDDEIETLKEVVLCGPQCLPNMMKEIVLFENHLDNLPIADGKVSLYTAWQSLCGSST